MRESAAHAAARIGVWVGLVASTLSCIATEPPALARGVVVAGPPPPPMAESALEPPVAGAQRVAGYWHWTGLRYVWIPGHWERPPAGATWQAPRYSTSNGSYVYEPGVWTGRKSALR